MTLVLSPIAAVKSKSCNSHSIAYEKPPFWSWQFLRVEEFLKFPMSVSSVKPDVFRRVKRQSVKNSVTIGDERLAGYFLAKRPNDVMFVGSPADDIRPIDRTIPGREDPFKTETPE